VTSVGKFENGRIFPSLVFWIDIILLNFNWRIVSVVSIFEEAVGELLTLVDDDCCPR
jgi:hypothetical protein